MKNVNRWAALVGLGLCSCGSPPSSEVPPRSAQAISKPSPFVDASFATMNSRSILDAAMAYPVATITEAPAPPLSLTASDGTGLKLVSLDASAVIEGPLAFTELHLRFENPDSRVIEGRFAITLPPGAAISRLAMRLDSGWQEAEVVERQLARQAYEDFLHRRQDPALLEKEAGNEFRARVFPIPARGTKDIILSYSQEMADSAAPYRLLLRGLPIVDHIRLTALVAKPGPPGAKLGYAKTQQEHRSYKPDQDFEVALRQQTTGLRAARSSDPRSTAAIEDVVLARVRPEISADLVKLDGVVVLFDTSASRALGFAGEVARLGRLIAQIRNVHGDEARLMLAAFDQTVAPIFQGPVRDFSQKHLDALLARQPLGASNLHAALTWPGRPADHRRMVVFTDGIATAGPAEGDTLRAAVQGLKGGIDRLDVVLGGGIRDEETMTRLVQGSLEHDGILLDAALPEREIVRRLGLATRSGITVKVSGAAWSWPEKLDGRQPGDEVLVYAGMKAGTLAPGKPLAITLGADQKVEVMLSPVTRPLLERAAVNASIARLISLRDGLRADQTADRERLREQIIAISTRNRVLSDFTALLVLETDRDYRRFGIDRNALADILAIGEEGVSVIHRTGPVLAVAEAPLPPPTRPMRPAVRAASPQVEPRRPARMRPADPSVQEKYRSMMDAAPKPEPEERPALATDIPRADKPAELAEDAKKKESADGPGAAPSAAPIAIVAPRPEAPSPQTAVMAPPPPRPLRSPAPPTREAGVSPNNVRASEDVAPVANPLDELASKGPPPYTGRMAQIMARIRARETEAAVVEALHWRTEDPSDVMALIALGEALEAHNSRTLAARVYGSILDLFPARADLRRFAAQRLERLGADGAALAADSYAKSVLQRPDHLNGHRLLGYALLRQGKPDAAFAAIEAGLGRDYPGGRFLGGPRILREDLGLLGAAWLRQDPSKRSDVERRLSAVGAELPTGPSLRFVLHWETDANDVDFHIADSKGGHAYYSSKELPSGGQLYEDVTTGYGPECFTIEGTPTAYPYKLQLHYYSRGPMGYGMGKVEIIAHDGMGHLRFEQRPFVVMNDSAFVDLGQVNGPVGAQVAR